MRSISSIRVPKTGNARAHQAAHFRRIVMRHLKTLACVAIFSAGFAGLAFAQASNTDSMSSHSSDSMSGGSSGSMSSGSMSSGHSSGSMSGGSMSSSHSSDSMSGGSMSNGSSSNGH